jgi:hypothetical protein
MRRFRSDKPSPQQWLYSGMGVKDTFSQRGWSKSTTTPLPTNPAEKTEPAVSSCLGSDNWACPNGCEGLNFGSRQHCRQCGSPRQQLEFKEDKAPEIKLDEDGAAGIVFMDKPKKAAEAAATSQCVVCLDLPVRKVIPTCRHLVLCEKCSKLVASCPTCGVPVSSRVSIKVVN